MLELFENPDWSIQTQRVIAEGAYGGADAFEVVRTARTIAAGNVEAWYTGWLNLPKKPKPQDGRRSPRVQVTARQRPFRASKLLSSTPHPSMLGTDPRKRENYRAGSRDASKRRNSFAAPWGCGDGAGRGGSDIYDGICCHERQGPGHGGTGASLMSGDADLLVKELYFFDI